MLASSGNTPAADPAPQPLLIFIGKGADSAADHVQHELSAPAQVELLQADKDVVERARSSFPDAYIMFLDAEKNRALIVRPDDTVLSRELDSAEKPTPYALAIAAVELFRLARTNPDAAPPVAEAAPQRAPGPAESDGHLLLNLSLGLGLSAAPGHDETIARPTFGAELFLESNGWLSGFGLFVRGPGQLETEEDALGARLVYDRTDLLGRLALGPRFDDLIALGTLTFGGSITSVEAQRNGVIEGSDSRTPFWVALGVEGQLDLVANLALSLSVEVAGVLSPADFIVRQEVPLSEGDVRLLAQTALLWRLE